MVKLSTSWAPERLLDHDAEACTEGDDKAVHATKEHYQKATFLQHLTFSWATKLILRTFSNEIDADELWDLPADFSAEKATERLREKCKSLFILTTAHITYCVAYFPPLQLGLCTTFLL